MARAPTKPRVLIVITLAEAGGAQSSVSLLLPALADQFDVTLAAHGDGPLREAARAADVPFVALEHVRRSINPWRDLLGLIELVRLCLRLQPDILHAHSSKAGALGRPAGALAGVPIRIFTVHGWSFAAYRGLAGRAFLRTERLLRRLTTSVVCVAGSVRDVGVAERACLPERTVVIHNAVDVSSFGDRTGPDSVPRIVSVGRFAFPKDFPALVDALAATTPDYRAAFIGEGPLLSEAARRLERRGLTERVELLGLRADVPDVLADADIFVLASRSEGLPISILEAMAAGLPVVASDVGGVSEAVVHGETGLLVPPGDPEALASALELLLRDSPLRQRMGAAGRRRAQARFDAPVFGRAHVELYRRELARRGVTPAAAPLSAAAESGE
jgi:glycosyltransferase involved in cell wall biosynthesis